MAMRMSEQLDVAMELLEYHTESLNLSEPFYIKSIKRGPGQGVLTFHVDFRRGARFVPAGGGEAVTARNGVVKVWEHGQINQDKCRISARVPRIPKPGGGHEFVRMPWEGHVSGFSMLFEARVMSLLMEGMHMSGIGRALSISRYHADKIARTYVGMALEGQELAAVRRVAFDETAKAKGHDYLTLAVDMDTRSVIFVTEGKGADTIGRFAEHLRERGGDPGLIETVSIDMSPAFEKGVAEHLPRAEITYDKFHVVAQASRAMDQTRRDEQKAVPNLKRLRWKLLKNPDSLTQAELEDLAGLQQSLAGTRTVKAWEYLINLKCILARRQVNVVRGMLEHWCNCVMRSKVEAMKAVARMIRRYLDGIAAWARTRQTNGFIEAVNGLFQNAKRMARGYGSMITIKTRMFLVAGKLDYAQLNPYWEPAYV